MADGTVELRFDGVRYGFWQQVEIRESVDDLCASVRLSLSGDGTGAALPLTANTVVEVLVDGQVAATVRPDHYPRHVDDKSHTISFEGRSLARELVDCQYSATLNGLKLAELMKAVCKLFKVPFYTAQKTAVVPSFAMQCEMPSNALLNAARAANLLLYATRDGGLILTEPDNPNCSAPVASLEYGKHFKSYTVTEDFKQRYSHYVAKSFDYTGGKALASAAKDVGISYFRPMHIIADKGGQSLGALKRRAELERNRRLARAFRIDLVVPGWRHETGLWTVNTQVRVVIPGEGIDEVFLIGEKIFSRDDQGGSVTHLQVMPRAAFIGEERLRKKHKAGVRTSPPGATK
jgi:prophage tail gpP-like protein